MKHLATTLQVIGTMLVTMAVSIVSPPLGLGFAGVALVIFGVAVERS